MDVNKNSYTFTFAAIMVVVVAAILSFAATSLKPFQDKNIDLESKQNILKSIGVEIERDQADEYFSKYIKQQLVVQDGKVVEDPEVPALDINMAKEVKKDGAARTLPLYIAEKDGNTCFILPLRGKGLWGPVWGYISLESDGSTVIGANFDHEGETPGLGAEISKPIFMDQFPGKQIMKDGEFVSIEVRKGDASGDYQVDGISGGTITSVGVDDMLEDCIANYVAYLDKVSASAQEPVSIEKMEMEIDELMDSTATQQDSITAVALITE